jgi:hypothetical protein
MNLSICESAGESPSAQPATNAMRARIATAKRMDGDGRNMAWFLPLTADDDQLQ